MRFQWGDPKANLALIYSMFQQWNSLNWKSNGLDRSLIVTNDIKHLLIQYRIQLTKYFMYVREKKNHNTKWMDWMFWGNTDQSVVVVSYNILALTLDMDGTTAIGMLP